MQTIRYVGCEICGSDDAETLYEKRMVPHAAGRIVTCKKCGLVYVNPRERAGQWFDVPEVLDSFTDLIEARYPVYHHRIRQIERHKKGGRLLEIGCYVGAFLNMAKQNGWTCYGIEPSFVISDYAMKTYGINVFPGFLAESDFQSNFFDVVAMFHVLEHLPSPRKELREIHRILKPDGLLVIEVPNIEHPLHRLIKRPQWLFVPGHFYYFAPQTLGKLLNAEEFEVIGIEPTYKMIGIRHFGQILRKLGRHMGKIGNMLMDSGKTTGFSIKIRTNLNILVMAKPVKNRHHSASV
ncbi:MAG: class I SAM-dependent methyltransferase [Desulfobacterales bacterium]|nr:class I SAM-dependent methyltransferase [Desulfobacterales bacterium]